MGIAKKMARALSASALLLCSVTLAAYSQEQAATSAPEVIKESFDGSDPSLMLGGQIDLLSESAPWIVYVADGKLVMANRQNPQSLHYNDIGWVKFPESNILESTENLVISATVVPNNTGTGGAGILVGSGKNGVYVMFAVDQQGRFHILKKDGRKLRALHSALHPAVLIGQPNQLSFDYKGAHVAFNANGTELIQIPYAGPRANARQKSGQPGIGLAAFGIGEFFFESVEISNAN